MANIYINSIRILDSNQQLLQTDPVSGGFLAEVNPNPLGITGKLYYELVCSIFPLVPLQVQISATLINMADFRFTMGDGHIIQYFRQIQDNISFTLPFELANLKSPLISLPGDMLVEIAASNKPSSHIRVKIF